MTKPRRWPNNVAIIRDQAEELGSTLVALADELGRALTEIDHAARTGNRQLTEVHVERARRLRADIGALGERLQRIMHAAKYGH